MEETNKNKEKIFPHGFIFVFTPYIIGVIMSKNVFKCEGFEKIWKGGGGGGGPDGGEGWSVWRRGVIQTFGTQWYKGLSPNLATNIKWI